MKILAFTDIHENKIKIDQIIKKAKEVDLLICCGDFTWFGNDTEGVISRIAKTKKQFILLHGNHEDPKEVEKIAKKYDNVIFLNDNLYSFGDFQLFAHGGGGFSYRDKILEKVTKEIKKKIDKKKKLIFLTHAPPYGTKLDIMPFPGHVGCQSITKAILELEPILYMCGHIHECEGNKDKIGKTLALNPGRGKIITI